MFDPSRYPVTPIDPEEFTENVVQKFNEFGVFISDEMPEVIRQICGVLNLSITNHRVRPLGNKTVWALPAQTGIGKSVCLKVYVAMLQDKGALIILSKTDEVKEYAEHINQIRDDDEFSACLYRPKNKRDRHPCLVEKSSKWKEFTCLIITHKRYEDIAKADEKLVDDFRMYINQEGKLVPRELIIIDEKLSFYTRTSVTLKQFDNLISFLENALKLSDESLCRLNELTEQLRIIYEYLDDSLAQKGERLTCDIDSFELRKAILDKELSEEIRYESVCEIIESRFVAIFDEISSVSGLTNERFQKDVIAVVKSVASKLERILIDKSSSEYFYKSFVLYKDSRDSYLFKVSNLFHRLGSCIVLDATASVNEFYQFAHRANFSQIGLVDIPQIRKYSNLTIYKSKGLSQTKYALLDSDEKEKAWGYYGEAIKSILEEGDQLLIISYKDLVPTFEAMLADKKNIHFTHWGRHVGTNEWNSCNKVMIIGWNNLPPIETVSRIYGSSFGTSDFRLQRQITQELIVRFSVTQVVDDLVQGVMRTRARVISTADSDCQEAQVYLFYPDTFFGTRAFIILCHG